ncbi:MAG: HemD protein, partial [Candidatus Hydrogenedentes bacterium]|nr:HemD protein [Candidatus Hydrogenedentota bacterium]
ARNFAEILGATRLDAVALTAQFASIGPITSKTAAELGMPVTIEPDTHDIPSFVEAIVQAFTETR